MTYKPFPTQICLANQTQSQGETHTSHRLFSSQSSFSSYLQLTVFIHSQIARFQVLGRKDREQRVTWRPLGKSSPSREGRRSIHKLQTSPSHEQTDNLQSAATI